MIEYTLQQKEALRSIEFFLDGKQSVFMLMGYAGTGKTTLISSIVELIKDRHYDYQLMAPTGRAAKILSEKTGELASTIHRGIFELSRIEIVEGSEDEESSVEYRFPLRKGLGAKAPGRVVDPSQSVIIIDEASMVSSKKLVNDLFIFGSGVLLDDIIEYAQLDKGGKIIFIGDPAQLPPVGDADSMALCPSFLNGKGVSVSSYELTEIIRQDANSAILINSIKLRESLFSEVRTGLVLERKTGEVEDIDATDIPLRLYQLAPKPSINSPIVICYSNRAVSLYNAQIRQLYFPDASDTINIGDKLIIVGNNYSNPQRDLYNGEFAQVREFSDKIEKLTGVVYVKEGEGKRVRKTIDLYFREVTLELEDGVVVKTKVFEELLGNAQPNLTYYETCALMSNFRMRHPDLNPKSDEYAHALKLDPYYNAVRAKYGYAITCHKSQGGEWDTTFIDFSGRTGFSKDCLRWSYTAATRATRMMYGFGLHSIPPLKIKVVDIVTVSSTPSPFYSQENSIPPGPFYSDESLSSLKVAYWQINDVLQGSGYVILGIEHKQYREVYVIGDTEGSIYRCESIYNGAGIMRPFKEVTIGTTPSDLLKLLNSIGPYPFEISYSPNNPNLIALYNRIRSICSDFDIAIVNILDQTEHYKLIYCLKTDALYAYLEIYINKFGQVTYIAPKSDIGIRDTKLVNLVEAIRQ